MPGGMTMAETHGVRVRFAPSPTGELHVGGARTVLFNWLFARQSGGKFILRIEDTDQQRSKDELVQPILDSFRWLGLDWDEGPEVGGPYAPYFQSQRGEVYREYTERLVASGHAYPCYCTPEELAQRREAARAEGRPPRYDGRCRDLSEAQRRSLAAEGRTAALRLRVPDTGQMSITDIIRGEVTFDNEFLDDFVLVKSGGMPVYNFACVVDDHTMRITHVIRAEEHLSNTPKQVHIYRALGLPIPEFAHVPMVLAPDRSKLSKRHGATATAEYKVQGYLPEALINYLALVGWYPEDGEEFMSVVELTAKFRLDRVSKSAGIYDNGKLTWMNGVYLRSVSLPRLAEAAAPFLAGVVPEGAEHGRLHRVLDAVRDRVKTLAELPGVVGYFYSDQFEYEDKGVRKHFGPEAVQVLESCREAVLGMAPEAAAEAYEAAYRQLAERLGVQAGALIHPTRLALTGQTVGPGLFVVMELLGRDQCLARLNRAASFCRQLAAS